MNRNSIKAAALLAFAIALPSRAEAGTLSGSQSSMKQQHAIAVEEDMTFAKKPSQIDQLVDRGSLVSIEGNANFALSNVSFPYARPEVLLFIERLAAQYHADNGAKLVVTSLTRPAELQPKNAHKLSVHPAGMAVDFRVPAAAKQRLWLEKALLGLENARVLDVTREKNPPHYHVAVFPAEYLAYAEKRKVSDEEPAIGLPGPEVTVTAPPAVAQDAAAQNESRGLLLASSLIALTLFGASPLAKRYVTRR